MTEESRLAEADRAVRAETETHTLLNPIEVHS